MSNQNEKVIVNGFVFANKAEAEQAEKEIDGVKFIKEKLDMDKPEMVLDIYNKVVRQKLFETAVGYAYLKDLQEYLQSIPFVEKDRILPIQVSHATLEEDWRRRRPTAKKQEKTKTQYVNVDYKKKYRLMRGIAIVCAISVVAMFAISATANHPTILNYEQELINRYAQWEDELSNREAVILEKEAALGINGE